MPTENEDGQPPLPMAGKFSRNKTGLEVVWRHAKTGDLYRIVRMARNEKDLLQVVVYESLTTGDVLVSLLKGFAGRDEDGNPRFVREEIPVKE